MSILKEINDITGEDFFSPKIILFINERARRENNPN